MIHYLILAHKKNPKQLKKLIQTLKHQKSLIYVHLDASVELGPFLHLGKYVQFIPDRVRVNRGGFSMIKATLNSMYYIEKYMKTGDHFVLMSGQDMPIKSQKYIHNFLGSNTEKSYIQYIKQPNKNWNIINRFKKISFSDFYILAKLDYVLKPILEHFLNRKIEPRIGIFNIILNYIFEYLPWERNYLIKNFIPYGGSQWVIFNKVTFDYIVNFCKTTQGLTLLEFVKYCHIPDEFIFQTIIINSPLDSSNIINICQRETCNPSKIPKSPDIITNSCIDRVMRSKKLFARKFDIDVDSKAIDYVIKKIKH